MAAERAQKYEPPHGTERRYMALSCRCAQCKKARADAQRRRKESKALEAAVPVTSIDAAPSADEPVSGVEGSVRRLTQLVADDPQTQVRAQLALALARRIDRADGAPAPIAAQLEGLIASLKPVKSSGVVADGVAAPRLTAVRGSRGRLDPGGLPGVDGAAAMVDSA